MSTNVVTKKTPTATQSTATSNATSFISMMPPNVSLVKRRESSTAEDSVSWQPIFVYLLNHLF